MNAQADTVEIFEKMDREIKSDEEITDLELEIKIENPHEKVNIKTEVFEETNNSEPIEIIGEKRHFNDEKSNLENKKIKEEFVAFEELDYKEEPDNITEILLDDLNNQVIKIGQPLFKPLLIEFSSFYKFIRRACENKLLNS